MEGYQPVLLNALSAADISRIVEMAWEDRTPFEAIATQFGLTEAAVIKLMRAHLKAASFRMWRARVHGRATKHLKVRNPSVSRHKANHRI